MRESESSLKRGLFVHLAFALFGHIVGKEESGEIFVRTVSFVTTSEGDFFLLSRISDDLGRILGNSEVVFVVLKEGKSVSDMWDVRVYGGLVRLKSNDPRKGEVKKLFEDKSPYLGTVGFMDLDKDYELFMLSPKEIFFQNLGKQREGEPSHLLVRD